MNLVDEALAQRACRVVTDSDWASRLVVMLRQTMVLAMQDAGFLCRGGPTGHTVMTAATQDAVLCGQDLADPHTGAILTVASGLVVSKRPEQFGWARARWDILRPIASAASAPKSNRRLVTRVAFSSDLLGSDEHTGRASQLLEHVQLARNRQAFSALRSKCEEAISQLQEVLAP